MKKLSEEAVGKAEEFILRTARILERRRFEFLFRGGAAEPVLTALAAYRNPDGGYGNALEPDGRGPGSQPVTVLSALHVLHEVGAAPDGVADYLASISTVDGGVPFVHPNAADYPRAPWWTIPETYEASLLPTANLVGALWQAGVTHPWIDQAAEFCWPRIESLTNTHPYEALACVGFLDAAPDRARAEAAATKVGELVRTAGLVRIGDAGATPEGYNAAELHTPHEYAATPDSLARHWFTDEELGTSLDALVDAQGEDGGWRVRWTIWTPATEFEWAGWMTVQALTTLRAYGRLEQVL
ncbi:hypothetical protein [Actinokineospora sp. NBRC 105648]|uniref:hypothetical protein n=1 Tax=Actinokineospora sp. NBRC 105648 TaxID=3032206 RepID=UPI0024A521E0|nr:hypothetical protein [Actinokineospora sp. NBRC 105648]GLZ43020.1 hypothetical protein Acsp05_66440 [Actinokineospora sp. NBRC 105648]